jgi:hypothetical protein
MSEVFIEAHNISCGVTNEQSWKEFRSRHCCFSATDARHLHGSKDAMQK